MSRMVGKIVLFLIAAVFLVVGANALLADQTAHRRDCGSVLAPAADTRPCRDARSDAKPIAYGGLGLGAITVVLLVAVSTLGGTSEARRQERETLVPPQI